MNRPGTIPGAILGAAMTLFAPLQAAAKDQGSASPGTQNAHDFVFEMPHGAPLPLKELAGKVVLIVNTASECGFSGQLSGLQSLHEAYGERGLVVLGVPSNDFGGQEPRKGEEIAKFCEAKYGATFEMTAKTSVKGKAAHPFYKWAAAELGLAARPYWNFHKYLVGPDGQLAGWFSTPTKPMSGKMRKAIERQLKDLSESKGTSS